MKVSAYTLYGDGIHDDYSAIQEMLDSGATLVYLPPAEVQYTISHCLKIHSFQELKLDCFTRIVLSDHANCCMLENAEPEAWNDSIAVSGGIWDMNHTKQSPNPYHFDDPAAAIDHEAYRKRFLENAKEGRLFLKEYSGHCFRFNSIRNFTFRNVTIVNPVVYGVQMAYVEDFTVENITFRYTEGSPKLWNLDGVHLEGGCRNGVVKNLKGACHDDLLAITADDGKYGEIENIAVDGIFAEGCHSAVRLLSWSLPIRNIYISNIYGTYYVYCIIMSKYYGLPENRGIMENMTFDNIHASFSKGTVDVPGNYGPLIDIKEGLDIRNLVIRGLYRREAVCSTPTIGIGENTVINSLHISDCEQVNLTDQPIEFLHNEGTVEKLAMENVFEDGKLL